MHKTSWHAYLYLSPTLLLYSVFFAFPFIFSLYISFMKWDLIFDIKTYVGWSNYIEVWQSEIFWKSVRNTLLYILMTVPLSVGFGLLYALLIEQTKRLKAVYRVLFFFPVIISVAAAGLVFSLMYSPQNGLFNIALSYLGISPISWLQYPNTALISLAIVGIWMSFGYNVILYMTGLQQVDKEAVQAAAIDGAGPWKTFVHITMPLLTPVHLFVWIITILYSFQVFATVQIMTMGGPNNATNVWVFFIWQEAFPYANIGAASAAATLLFSLVLVTTIIQVTWLQKKSHV